MRTLSLFLIGSILFMVLQISSCSGRKTSGKPNIIFAISDDQGFPYAGAYGARFVNTPGFDRVAAEGLLFDNVYCAVPQCSPNRASILTGRYLWQNAEGGTHASLFPAHLRIFTDLLIEGGYEMASTGKTWGPGVVDTVNRLQNRTLIGNYYSTDNEAEYWKEFQKFIRDKDPGKPFFFWYGTNDPHRTFDPGSGLAGGKKLEDVDVPPYLPDSDVVRSDFLDYAVKIERFDSNLVKMIEILEQMGELDNTLIIVTSDNGMPYPRAKGNAYDAGVHVPMAVRWGDRIPAGKVITDLISHIDLAPTLLDIAGLPADPEMEGLTFKNLMLDPESAKGKPFRENLFYGRERATSARPNNLGYPARTIRTQQYQLVWNMKPDRYPAGDRLNENEAAAVTKEMIRLKEENPEGLKMYESAFGLRPEFELYDMTKDPWAMVNLAGEPGYQDVVDSLFTALKIQLTDDGDPRMLGQGDIWESYPRFMRINNFGCDHPAYQGVYNDHYVQPGQRIPEYLLDSKDYKTFFEKTGITRDEHVDKLKGKGVLLY
jgi:N-sulfoglucosamine sulfohydrolase